ncbi:MAG: TolC family protein [Flavobacterium sp.]|jgi:outer membrane protein|uniref:TolC family protein n=2 Tax=Flavobacterium sp. TaxID=239 RepID=UPI0022C55C4F|nr:TolC family protein [Flavobacterium sp.]MCZ8169303.1 TolC family protein [Flavobacterium sp.]MCZ8298464.1 TolC family protein [Flavobacterium sp.]
MKIRIFAVLLLLPVLLKAQEQPQAYAFTLKEAIDHAIQYNYSAINANRDVEAAKKKKWETTTIGLPQINGNVSYQDNFRLQQSLIPAEFFGGQPGEFIPVAFGTKHNMNAVVTLSQLIFDGSYLVGLQSAKTYLKISENAKVKTNRELREIVTTTYGNVLLADESIHIFDRNKAALEKTLSDTREIYKNGFAEEESVEQLQITLASVNSALENVKRQKRIALDMLKLVLGINLEDQLTLKDKLEFLTQTNMDLAILKEQFEVKNNIDYQIGQNTLTSSELLLKLEKSKALPSLGAQVNFGANTFGNRFTMFNSDQLWFNYSNVGLGLTVPIFSSLGRSARTQQAKIAVEQSKTRLTELEQTLKLQFEKAKSDYEFSLEQLGTSKNSMNLAERIESKNQIKFKEGLTSSFDLTDAQRQLYSAQQSYLQAMVDVITKRAALEKLLSKN